MVKISQQKLRKVKEWKVTEKEKNLTTTTQPVGVIQLVSCSPNTNKDTKTQPVDVIQLVSCSPNTSS